MYFCMLFAIAFVLIYMTFYNLQNSIKSSPKMQKNAISDTLDFEIFRGAGVDPGATFRGAEIR